MRSSAASAAENSAASSAAQRGEHRPQARPAQPLEHRIVAGKHVHVGRLPRVDLESGVEQQGRVGRSASRPRRDGAALRAARRPTAANRPARASACAPARRSCRAPGTRASLPAGSAAAHARARGRCGSAPTAAPRCSTMTSTSGCGVHAVTSPIENDTGESSAAAAAIISADESMPSTAASGQRAASSAVSAPGPAAEIDHPARRRRRRSAPPDRGTGGRARRRSGRIAKDPSACLPRYLDVKR